MAPLEFAAEDQEFYATKGYSAPKDALSVVMQEKQEQQLKRRRWRFQRKEYSVTCAANSVFDGLLKSKIPL